MLPKKSNYITTNITMNNNQNNRYSIYDIYEDDKKNRFAETISVRIASIGDNDIYHTVSNYELYRWDLIAQKYYGDWRLQWVIMEANEIIDPFDMKVGMLLRIPAYKRLFLSGEPLEDF